MSGLEAALRDLIASVVRDEVKRVIQELTKPDEYLTTDVAAEVAHVSPGTIRRWIRERKLKPFRSGRLRVSRAELEALLRGSRKHLNDDLTPEEWADRIPL